MKKHPWSASRRVVAPLVATILLLVAAGGAALWSQRGERANVAWPQASPRSEGFDAKALREMKDSLALRDTKVLLVARHGRLVFEWYADDFGANRRHFTSAMAKGVSAAPTLIAAAQDGLLSLDDHVSDWVPEWKADPRRSRVRLIDLAFHQSGLQDVDFDAGQAGELPDWQQRYYDHPNERFRLALDSAAFLFDPGTRLSYSGVGFYVLSYVVSRALQNRSPVADIPSFVDAEVYGPMGLPRKAWSLGYGRSDTIDGMALTHFGSGGEVTGRAAARIGQVMLQRGCWEGRQVLDADLVDRMLGRGETAPIVGEDDPGGEPASLGGWWSNANGAWPSAPRSVMAAVGGQNEIVLLDPDNEVVAVRMGGDLRSDGRSFHAAFDEYFMAPLYAALEEDGTAHEAGAPVATSPRNGADGDRPCRGRQGG